MSHSPLQIRRSRVCIIQLLLHFSKDELNAHPVVSYYYMQSAKLEQNALPSQARGVFPFAAQAALCCVLITTQAHCTRCAHRSGLAAGGLLLGVIAGLGEQYARFPFKC